jgi:hypothetical protein
VSLDGAFVETVDLYAPTPSFTPRFDYAVASGRHTLRVTVRGDAQAVAGGVEVGVDFFEVVEPVGGKGFGIRRDPGALLQTVVATWSPGTAQGGYLLARASASGTLVLPLGGTPLRPDATTFSEVSFFSDPVYCYVLLPVDAGAGTAIANSDVLCMLSAPRSGSAPGGFTLRLNQSSQANLSWQVPLAFLAAAPDYLVVVLGADPTVIPVPAGTLQATHDTGGAPTCYAVVAVVAGEPVGTSEVLCGVPGLARL